MMRREPDLFTPRLWTALAPGLHVAEPEFARAVVPPAAETGVLDACADDVLREGYGRWRPGGWAVDLSALAAAADSLDETGLPAAFLFVYDETWLLFAGIRPLLSRLLGEGYRMLPDFWAWHVAARDDDAGWAPHRDRGRKALLADGGPAALTAWIAISEATPDNGCMYLVPADRDPTYNTAAEDEHRFALSDIRALPAAPGTILFWNQAVLHWGARSSRRGTGPRISASVEFQRGDVDPFNTPLLPSDVFPDLDGRLRLIAKQLVQYSHMYRATPAVTAFLERIAGT